MSEAPVSKNVHAIVSRLAMPMSRPRSVPGPVQGTRWAPTVPVSKVASRCDGGRKPFSGAKARRQRVATSRGKPGEVEPRLRVSASASDGACRCPASTFRGNAQRCFPVRMRTSRRIHRKAGSSEGNLMKPPSCLLASCKFRQFFRGFTRERLPPASGDKPQPPHTDEPDDPSKGKTGDETFVRRRNG
jgi:hypothetical protein